MLVEALQVTSVKTVVVGELSINVQNMFFIYSATRYCYI